MTDRREDAGAADATWSDPAAILRELRAIEAHRYAGSPSPLRERGLEVLAGAIALVRTSDLPGTDEPDFLRGDRTE